MIESDALCSTCNEPMELGPNVEAFEAEGVIICDLCAEAILESQMEESL